MKIISAIAYHMAPIADRKSLNILLKDKIKNIKFFLTIQDQ